MFFALSMEAMAAQAAPNSKSAKMGFIVDKQKNDITLTSVSSKAHYCRLNAYKAPYILVELNRIITQRTKLFQRVKECLGTVLCPPIHISCHSCKDKGTLSSFLLWSTNLFLREKV